MQSSSKMKWKWPLLLLYLSLSISSMSFSLLVIISMPNFHIPFHHFGLSPVLLGTFFFFPQKLEKNVTTPFILQLSLHRGQSQVRTRPKTHPPVFLYKRQFPVWPSLWPQCIGKLNIQSKDQATHQKSTTELYLFFFSLCHQRGSLDQHLFYS